MKRRIRLGALAAAASAALLLASGCANHSQQVTTVSTAATAPDEFPWVSGTLSATATGTASAAYAQEPQKSIAARQNGKTAAIADLKKQVRQLPVAQGKLLGEIMDENIGVKRAVEKYLQTAQVVSTTGVEQNTFDVSVSLPLAPLAEILKQHYITFEELPEVPEREPSDIPPVT